MWGRHFAGTHSAEAFLCPGSGFSLQVSVLARSYYATTPTDSLIFTSVLTTRYSDFTHFMFGFSDFYFWIVLLSILTVLYYTLVKTFSLGTNNVVRMVWYVMLGYDMVLYGVVWYGMLGNGRVWYGRVGYGRVWYGMVWYCRVLKGRVW